MPFVRFLILIKISFILLTLSGCIQKNVIDVNLKTKSSSNLSVTNVQLINNQFVFSGNNLNSITHLSVNDGTITNDLQIESKATTYLVANSMSNITLAAGKIFSFILSNANASSTFTVDFSLCNSKLGGKSFDCTIVPNDKEVLSYDAASGKWKPRAVNGLTYLGAWDASGGGTPGAKPEGSYYIVGVAGNVGGAYSVGNGDWIVSNGSAWQKIDNSTAIVTVFGRTGVVSATEGDYVLDKLGDVDLTTTPPITNQVLKYNGTQWIPGTATITEVDPTVQTFAKNSLPTCSAGEVLKSNGSIFSCVTDSTGAGAFSGTSDRVIVTDGTGALSTSSVSTTNLNYLSNVTSDIQAQLNSKLNSSSFVDWSTTGVQTIDPTRLNLTTANRAVVTNASGVPVASSVTSIELGYLAGVTSSIQTQLNSKLSSYTETDPNVSAFAKAALPTCNAGEVLKSNGTSFSCVTDVTGAGAYSGTLNRLVLTDGATGALTTSSVTNTEAGYLSGVTSAIQTQLNAKQATIDKSTVQDVSKVRIYGANATNYVELSAATLTGNRALIFPDSNGTSGQALVTDGSGNLSWATVSAGGPANTDVLSEGSTNLYFTTSRVLSTQITAPTLTNSAIATGDTLQTIAGKLQAQINNNSITTGTTSQYFRGDKSWQTLDTSTVTENTNLYFTDARAKAASVADAIADSITNVAPSQNAVYDALTLKLNSSSFVDWSTTGVQTIDPTRLNLTTANRAVVTNGSGVPAASSVTSTELGYVSGVTSAIQTQLNAKQATITNSTALVTGSVQTNLQGALQLNPYGTSAGNTGELRFYELVANGSNYIGFKSGNSIAANVIWTLPTADGTNGQVLQTNGSGVLSWNTPASAPVTSVFSRTGAVTATAGDYTAAQITNTAAGNIASTTVQTAINELDTEKQNISSLATDVRAIVLTGLSTATNAVITATDSILGAFGKLQKQITDLTTTVSGHTTSFSNKADLTNGAQSITASNINVTTINGTAVPVSSQWTTSGSNISFTSGNVGIGTSVTSAKLTVQGAAVSKTNLIDTGTSVNLALANNHFLKSPGGSSISLSNLADGGAYTLVISDTTSRTYTFSGCSNSYFSPSNGVTSGQSTYTILVVDDGGILNCYITWITGFN